MLCKIAVTYGVACELVCKSKVSQFHIWDVGHDLQRISAFLLELAVEIPNKAIRYLNVAICALLILVVCHCAW
jgi:hypothetical protein